MTSEPLSEEDLRALATSVLDAYRAAGWSEPSTTAVVLHALPVVARIRDEAAAAARAEAWDEGHRLTRPHSDACEPTCPNPYRAALSARPEAARGEGER